VQQQKTQSVQTTAKAVEMRGLENFYVKYRYMPVNLQKAIIYSLT